MKLYVTNGSEANSRAIMLHLDASDLLETPFTITKLRLLNGGLEELSISERLHELLDIVEYIESKTNGAAEPRTDGEPVDDEAAKQDKAAQDNAEELRRRSGPRREEDMTILDHILEDSGRDWGDWPPFAREQIKQVVIEIIEKERSGWTYNTSAARALKQVTREIQKL